ncbi:conserved hypothetical protein [Segniliparus rotundus DSM 44985]|uniref:Probable queuosine precursor transporter n=1 Tax=Segniliparus rotundus (strain ATCC BAA-972 / CDC 1076 / CIP 108378 / DSM 44985 / JCM 13578) TaxID=640132 RepID=D6Z9A5_SEGRD|nr:queuosine precursor transporter [Segniliparus rotundus]ADG98535.1 conserved hypothetical protein [Segniliparus rotundus DSM 44985]
MSEPQRGARVHWASAPSTPYVFLAQMFMAVEIISNITATKSVELFSGFSLALGPVQILPVVTDGAFLLFPLSYVIGDVLSEVYGFKATRRVVWAGFAGLVLAALCFRAAISLPAAPFFDRTAAFASVLGATPWLLAAGLAGFVCGELVNSYVLVALKRRSGERRLWLRLSGSTLAGEFVDTVVFCSIAASAIGIATWRDFINYTVFGFLWKSSVEFLVMPVTYQAIKFVKRAEPSYGIV